MRVVLDTNTILSALFWSGLPGKVYQQARTAKYTLLTSSPLLMELELVLQRPKFQKHLDTKGVTLDDVIQDHRRIALQVKPQAVPQDAIRDRKDRIVLGCALGGEADYIVSGDKDVLSLGRYEGISIVTSADFIAILNAS
jgi:putative PIN family toxin of toxin-antitoxin system